MLGSYTFFETTDEVKVNSPTHPLVDALLDTVKQYPDNEALITGAVQPLAKLILVGEGQLTGEVVPPLATTEAGVALVKALFDDADHQAPLLRDNRYLIAALCDHINPTLLRLAGPTLLKDAQYFYVPKWFADEWAALKHAGNNSFDSLIERLSQKALAGGTAGSSPGPLTEHLFVANGAYQWLYSLLEQWCQVIYIACGLLLVAGVVGAIIVSAPWLMAMMIAIATCATLLAMATCYARTAATTIIPTMPDEEHNVHGSDGDVATEEVETAADESPPVNGVASDVCKVIEALKWLRTRRKSLLDDKKRLSERAAELYEEAVTIELTLYGKDEQALLRDFSNRTAVINKIDDIIENGSHSEHYRLLDERDTSSESCPILGMVTEIYSAAGRYFPEDWAEHLLDNLKDKLPPGQHSQFDQHREERRPVPVEPVGHGDAAVPG